MRTGCSIAVDYFAVEYLNRYVMEICLVDSGRKADLMKDRSSMKIVWEVSGECDTVSLGPTVISRCMDQVGWYHFWSRINSC